LRITGLDPASDRRQIAPQHRDLRQALPLQRPSDPCTTAPSARLSMKLRRRVGSLGRSGRWLPVPCTRSRARSPRAARLPQHLEPVIPGISRSSSTQSTASPGGQVQRLAAVSGGRSLPASRFKS
jgi:hypothetical protein